VLRIRGLGFRRRDSSQVAPADLTRIDVCWSAAAGLSVVDTIRGADFQARGLLLALRAGEPSRIARSVAMEAAQAAIPGGKVHARTARVLALADGLAQEVGDPHVVGLAMMARGTSAYLEGRWEESLDACDRATALFRERCTGVAWEVDTAQSFALWSLSHMGAMAELGRRWPVLLQEVHERGDLYAVMNLSTYLMSIVRLAANDPDGARDELHRTMSRWSRQGYHVQHNDALWAEVQIELYRGDGVSAWARLERAWPALARSMLLRVQFIRISMHFLRARTALAAAERQPGARAVLLRAAEIDARRLERERMPYADAFALLIRGLLAAATGDEGTARTRLTAAASAFDGVAMALCAASTRRRLGILIGGESGEGVVAESEARLISLGVTNPVRMAGMYAPGTARGAS
jgi:hypothetical protein